MGTLATMQYPHYRPHYQLAGSLATMQQPQYRPQHQLPGTLATSQQPQYQLQPSIQMKQVPASQPVKLSQFSPPAAGSPRRLSLAAASLTEMRILCLAILKTMCHLHIDAIHTHVSSLGSSPPPPPPTQMEAEVKDIMSILPHSLSCNSSVYS